MNRCRKAIFSCIIWLLAWIIIVAAACSPQPGQVTPAAGPTVTSQALLGTVTFFSTNVPSQTQVAMPTPAGPSLQERLVQIAEQHLVSMIAVALAVILTLTTAAYVRSYKRQKELSRRITELSGRIEARDERQEEARVIQPVFMPEDPLSVPEDQPAYLESVSIRNFKNIRELDIAFNQQSSLPGRWTCIAGINGAGKSSILQAICLLLLGDRLIADLGGERLARMLRRDQQRILDAELRAVVSQGNDRYELYLPLGQHGVNEIKLRGDPGYTRMRGMWNRLSQQMLVSYGASRNLSDDPYRGSSGARQQVRRQMTLFDPMVQIAGMNVLIRGRELESGREKGPILDTLVRLLNDILTRDHLGATIETRSERVVFSQSGANVEAIELPDGFRSTVAWLADLCTAWHEAAPEGESNPSDPTAITGIVLLDEINLHLHPSLERTIVSRIRRALPNVQFITTTHSPLVLSSFDKAELIVLDRDSPGGVRELDRQIFSFSSNEIYEWLMNTPPQSTVLQDKVIAGDDPNLAAYLYQSPQRSADEAEELAEARRRLLDELGFRDDEEV